MSTNFDDTWKQLRTLIQTKRPDLKDPAPDALLFEALGFDSLTMMGLVFEIEKSFGIRIRGDDLNRDRVKTCRDLVALIEARKLQN